MANDGAQRAWVDRYSGRRSLSAQTGEATYYSDVFSGKSTASGEAYDPHDFTAAHRTLPFGTILRVRPLDCKDTVVYVRVNDRGPFGKKRRVIDVSRAAAERLGMLRMGVIKVRAEVVEFGPR